MAELDRVGKSDTFKGGSIVSACLREALAGNSKKMECLHSDGSATYL